MKKRAGLPVLKETEYVIVSGSLNAVNEAVKFRRQGKKVLIAVPETSLAPEICDTFLFNADPQCAAFFTEEITAGGNYKPAAVKKYLEDRCDGANIDLLYGVRPLDCLPYQNGEKDGKLLRIAAKGGMFGILCDVVLREQEQTGKGVLTYSALTREEGKTGFGVLTVSMETAHVENRDEASCLEQLQQMVTEEFCRRREAHPALMLGRFAPRASIREPDTFALEEWIDTAQPAGRPTEVETGNEFVRNGRYPLLDRCDRVNAAEETFDIAVAGGGTAGAMAALYAARFGAKTVLIEPEYVLGGTQTAGGVSTYWFGNRFADVAEIDRETDRYMEGLQLKRRDGIWSGSDDFHPGIRAFVLQKLCLKAGVEIRYGQLCFGAVCETDENNGREGCAGDRRVTGVAAAGRSGVTVYRAKSVIDATGDGDIAVFAGAQAEYGSGRDCITYWASLAQYTDVNEYRNNFSTMVIEADPADMTRFIRQTRQRGKDLFDCGRYVSMRESRHIRAKKEICLQDLMAFREYPDALYTCYSNYDPKGKLDADVIYCGVLPPQSKIQIPLSALLPCREDGRQIGGLYVAGKAVGATHNVFPSIRMQPDLMHQGAVLGGLLAVCLREGIGPEEMEDEKRRAWILQLTGDSLTMPMAEPDAAAAVYRLNTESRSHWVDVPFSYEETKQAEILTVMLAEPKEVLPYLEKRILEDTAPYDWKKEDTKEGASLRILLIGCSLWHGSKAFSKEYADYLLWQLEGETLPWRCASVMCAQLLPDHGVMPEFVYRMNQLGSCDAKAAYPVYQKVLELLKRQDRDYREIRQGTYHYIESFAYALETGGLWEFSGMIEELLSFPEFLTALEEGAKTDLLTERLLILQLILCRALARFGEEAGAAGLKKLSACGCMAVSVSAQAALLGEWKAGRRTERIW